MTRYNNKFVDSPSRFVLDEENAKKGGEKKFKKDPNWVESLVPSEGELNNPARRKKRAACSEAGISPKKYKKLRK